MCDLFGLSCNHEDRANVSLDRFVRQTTDPERQDRGPSTHGWGVVWWNDRHRLQEVKAEDDQVEKPAKDNEKFYQAIECAKSTNIIVHTRRASKGEKCGLNCHPFTTKYFGREWGFAHNGTVMGIQRHQDAIGTTDSENVFLWMMDHVKQNYDRDGFSGFIPALKSAIKKILDDDKRWREKESASGHAKLNFLLSDGDMHYAYSNYPGRPICMIQRSEDIKKEGPSILLSTEKLNELPDSDNWKEIPQNRLLTLNCGQIIDLDTDIIEASTLSKKVEPKKPASLSSEKAIG